MQHLHNIRSIQAVSSTHQLQSKQLHWLHLEKHYIEPANRITSIRTSIAIAHIYNTSVRETALAAT